MARVIHPFNNWGHKTKPFGTIFGMLTCTKNLPFSIYTKFSLAAMPRGHKQRKLNELVNSFLLFVSSKPHYQAEFFNITKVVY